MKFFLSVIMFLAISTVAYCEDVVYPYKAAVSSDPELKNLEWNRYTAQDFTVLSIDNDQGKWLSDKIEGFHQKNLTKWGFPKTKITKECRIFCVPNKTILKKLFGLEQPKAEIRKDLTVIWTVLDEKSEKNISFYLTPISLAEFESSHNVKLAWWFKKGCTNLNATLLEIRQNISSLQPKFDSNKMFTMTEEDYNKESVENRKIFDQQAVALCLMLRKEFGEVKLQGFLRITNRNSPQDVLKVIYGFSGYGHFDKQYTRFMRDLSSDVINNKTPDSYLEIKPVRIKGD